MNQRTTPSRVAAVFVLVVVVASIVAVAFRGSWGALRDAALAAHFDRDSASLYPLAVDGLQVIAGLSAVLLRHDRWARRYCLGIVAAYTGASWLINFLHGLGMFAIDPDSGARPVPPWPVVVVIASLVIGSIFLGSHLLVYVWRHLFPSDAPATEDQAAGRDDTQAGSGGTLVPEPPAILADNYEAATIAYRQSLTPGMQRLSQKVLCERFQLTRRQAVQVQHEVDEDLGSEIGTEAEDARTDEAPLHSPNGHGPSFDRGEV